MSFGSSKGIFSDVPLNPPCIPKPELLIYSPPDAEIFLALSVYFIPDFNFHVEIFAFFPDNERFELGISRPKFSTQP